MAASRRRRKFSGQIEIQLLIGDFQTKSPAAMQTILCPTDCSESSQAGIQYAKELALHTKARLVLLHAIPKHSVFTPVINLFPMDIVIRDFAKAILATPLSAASF
jgi:hypothetical protein